MSKHTSTRRESRNGVSVDRIARLPSGSLPLRRTWPISLCIGLAIGSIAVSPDAFAGGPTGGTVVGGTGSITQAGNETVINQISQKLALNWETFNLKANESVLFNQPGRSAVALNRILDQNPSQIFGKINSNGQVFLINTHGIIFGATAQMNVGGLMASTLDLTPKDFLAGNYTLNAVGAGAGIVNHGLIQAASGGSVALVGGSVVNHGVILANYGSINLDGAEHAVLDFDGNGLINIQITGELKQRLDDKEAAVSNTGTLKAEGGTVVLQASAAKDLFTNLVNNSGVIDASGISTDGGVVRLVGNGGNVESSGSINVSGVHGGSAQMLSDRNVSVTGSVDASGVLGGGRIRVGGGWQGGEGLQRSMVTYVGPQAVLNADATQSGSGGSVVVWSDKATGFMGSISARGGSLGGNGGNAEVSSHGYLQFDGNADLRAAQGDSGLLLLDPGNVTISNGADSGNAFDGSGNLVEGATDADSNIRVSTLVGLLGTGNVSVTAAGNIDVQKSITYAGSNNRSLTLTAGNVLSFASGAVVSATGTGSLSGVLSGVNGVSFASTSGFAAKGGDLSVASSAGSITIDGALSGLANLVFSGASPTGTGSIAGSGSISGLGSTTFNLTGVKQGTAGGITFDGFTAADTTTVTGAAGFDNTTKSSLGMAFAAATSVTGTGAITNLGGTAFNLTGTTLGTAGGTTFSGFTAADTTTVTGAVGFDNATKSSLGMAFAAATSVTGTGAITNLGGTAFNLTGTTLGTAGGTTFSGFTAADTTTVTGAVGFDNATKSSLGMAFAAATSVTGTGAITNLGGTAFNLTGTTLGTAGGTTFSGFTAADTTTVTGAVGFDDVAKTSQGMTFASATSVGGSGTIANVVGSFADNTGTSSASGIAYSGFGAVTGTGGSVTGVTGSFNLGTKVSGASGIDYSGFGVTTLTGSGAGATIAGSGQTYTLNNTIANQGSSAGVTWTGFGSIADASGTVAFGTGGSLSGNVTAATLNYGSYGSAVTFDLANGSGATTGIGGTWNGVTTVTGNGNSAITGSSTFALSGVNAGTAGSVAFSGFTAADAATITGAVGFDDVAKTSQGMTFASATSVGGSGTIANVVGSFADNTGTSSASGIAYSGFGAVTGTGGSVTGVTGSFNLGTKVSGASGIDYSGFGVTTLTGSGAGATIAGSGQTYTLNNTIANQGSSAGVTWTGFGSIADASGTVAFGTGGSLSGNVTAATLNYGSYGSAVTFDLADGSGATTGIGGTWNGVTAVTGNGSSSAITGSSTFALSGPNAGSAGGVTFAGFTAADAATITGAAGFNSATKSSLGMTFANATSVAGTGAITNLGGTAFNLTGTTLGTAGGTTFSGFTAADTTTVTGAVGFDDVAKTSQGMTFASATSVGGSGTIANVVGSFADNTGTSSASGIAYSGFGAVTGTGGSVTGVTGSFNLGTKVSSASTIDYSGFNLATLAGSGAGATIAGSNQTYNLTGTDAGNNGTLSWTSFGNLSDSGAGTFVFANGAGVSGMLTSAAAGTLDYSAYTTAVNVNLGGTATGTGGWSGITTAKGGSASDTISGSSRTYSLTGLNAGNSGTMGWTSFENIADAGIGTLTASNQTWSLTGHNQGTMTNLAGAFSGIGNLIDAGTGHFLMHSGADGDISGNLDAGTDGSLDYSGYTTAVNVNLAGAGSTGVGGTSSGISAVTASSNLGISGNASNGLTITTTGAGTTTTLGATAVGGDLNITASGAVLQTGGALSVAGTSAIDAGSNAITLTGGSNDFGGTVNLTGGATQINDLNALTLGTVNTGALTVGAGDLTLAGAVNGTAVSLTSSGTISESAGGSLTATSLTGHSAGATTLDRTNHINSLGGFSAAGFALINAEALTVNGPVNGGASTGLTTTIGDLAINGAVNGTTTTLTSAGAITEGAGGVITAGTLTGSSIGASTLNGANLIDTLGNFTAADFALTNAQALAVAGPVNGGASTSLTTTAGDLAINGAVSGTTTTLISAGAITEGAGGSITANLLTGHSIGNTTLDGNNHINILGGFSADFSLTNGQTLTVEGPLDGGPLVALTTTAGDLIINGTVIGATTTLTSAGAIIEGVNGVITADTLTGSSAGSTSLLGANQVAALGAFVSGGDFGFNTIQTLTVNDAPSANGGAGNLTLTASGASSDLILASTLTGNTVTLGAGRSINQTAGSIHATTLTGSSVGSTTLNGANRIGTLGSFTAAGFALTNAQALAVTGAVDGGASTSLKTTSGDLAINGSVKGTTTTLTSAGAITEGAAGSITAGTLTGSSAGATTLNGTNRIGTLGSFTAASFALSNAQALAVSGTLDGGASASLKTTSGDLAINGAVKGTATTLTSAGAITEGAAGIITAGTLTGSSVGATTLNGANQVGTLGSFTAANFALTNAQALAVTGPVSGGASTALKTTAGDLAINGAVNGTATSLISAGAISEGAGGIITAGTLSGSAVGPTVLGSAGSPNKNMVDTLGNFTSLAGFSMTNDKTLTLASVAGSAFTVNAGTSSVYLSVTHGDLFQLGTTPLYDGVGMWGSTGRLGSGSQPIYVVGTGLQSIANVGLPPAYFYAVDSSGNLLPLGGGFAINVPTASGAGSAQNGNHGDSYIDPSVITANYRSYGIVPSGVRLPADQQSGCDPDQPDQAACQDPDALGMVMPWPKAPQ